MATINPKIKVNLIGTLLFLSSNSFAADYIAPPMVNISEGSFTMGSNVGNKRVGPAHEVKISAFQLAKYHVTVREFKKFVNDTGYEIPATCNDYIGENWMNGPDVEGTASWKDNKHLFSEFQPVTCIRYDDAVNYANWLSNKAGKSYRLPTEQEWEYATKANTTSRFFWGDDPDLTQACQYGNFPDNYGEYFPNQQYGASYVGFWGYLKCNDYEPYTTLVGMYRANPFGLYDMLGNISEMVASCWVEQYDVSGAKPKNIDKCDMVVHRGFGWHSPPKPHYEKWRIDRNIPFDGVGFRLASDMVIDDIDATSIAFEKQLIEAQKHRRLTRPIIPDTPSHVYLKSVVSKQYELHWSPSKDNRVVAYDIYRSTTDYAHHMGKYFKNYYSKVASVTKTQSSFKLDSLTANTSFRVVAVTDEFISLPSNIALFDSPSVQKIPGKIEAKYATQLHGVLLEKREAKKDKQERIYLSKLIQGHDQNTVIAKFKVNVEESGFYQLNYSGYSTRSGTLFKLWSGNKLLSDIDYDPNIDDKSSNRHQVYLEMGLHDLQFSIQREGFDWWELDWLEFRKAN
ncbi:SUMF1/EgtB/PvdO family nonheme iron enzyme [Pseudoalteromonas aurantia]|uniref:Sulfatase-modifying factor enzyme-like domain-containing protein n=1 Tax=Pseudoalteromonas aurantia TaxID=43654 RepID=A0A5S3V654_9GAMM|nr:SUMF1/EgtB/PvdO family nonheme iron enzyme [Pseudoalteromonas aurantia]TMO66833.1 hypothetical protein CWC19_15200 [Pseudoalteromonas aurantia]TMO78726.1 hypothetical protein CWC20_01195 [Pseudoalteromonas aurantia]